MKITQAYTEDGYIIIVWQDTHLSDDKYPYVYLRDCCLCTTCFNHDSKQRMFLLNDLDVEVKANELQLEKEGECVSIEWSDGHRSTFESDWLRKRSFKSDEIHKRELLYGEEHVSWGKEFQSSIPTFNFQKVMTDDQELLDWLLSIDKFGLTVLTNVPCNDQQLPLLAGRVAYLKKNPFGETFTVISKAKPTNLAYTPVNLGFHTDQSYLGYPPEIQMLQCIKQAKVGGENLLADSFHAVKIIREKHPDVFQILTSVPIDSYATGNEKSVGMFHAAYRHPVVRMDAHDTIHSVFLNPGSRNVSTTTVPLEMIKPLYAAIKLLNTILNENMVKYKMAKGDMLAFNNNRVLHARVSYQLKEGEERHLEGGYFDWDEARSRIRVLRETLFGERYF